MPNNSKTIAAEPIDSSTFAPSEGSKVVATHVTPWTYATNTTSQTLVIPHQLGKVPTVVAAQFTPDQQTVYPLTWSWETRYSGNPVTISADAFNVYMQITSDFVLHGSWSGSSRTWTTWNAGFFRAAVSA